jgi:hypothetical protein
MTTDDWDEITKPYSYPPPFLQEHLPTEQNLEKPLDPSTASETLPSPPPDFFDEEEFISLPDDALHESTSCSIFSNYCSLE